MLTFRFTDADGCLVVEETLTSGMVGKEVKLEFSSDWDDLTKTAVFMAGSVTRDVVGVSDVVTIPAEVLAVPMNRLYVGVYGVSEDGKVTPTIRARGPEIEPGADPSGDQGTDPELPVWAQLDQRLTKMEQDETGNGSSDSGQNGNGLTAAQIAALDGMFKVCAFIKADVSAEYAAFHAAFGITESGDGTHIHSYTPRVTTAATCTEAGVRTYTCSCGSSYTEAIPATGHNYVDGVCTVCGAADPAYKPEVTLTGISAVYTGGDVPVGTAVTDLIGIAVTAHYSDGSTETVTGYTLSGTIAEGSNTITVSYGGMTTTISVTGVAEEVNYAFDNGSAAFDSGDIITVNGNTLTWDSVNTAGSCGTFFINLSRVADNTRQINDASNINNKGKIFRLNAGDVVNFTITADSVRDESGVETTRHGIYITKAEMRAANGTSNILGTSNEGIQLLAGESYTTGNITIQSVCDVGCVYIYGSSGMSSGFIGRYTISLKINGVEVLE